MVAPYFFVPAEKGQPNHIPRTCPFIQTKRQTENGKKTNAFNDAVPGHIRDYFFPPKKQTALPTRA
ncbi:MAG: hypothetical protein D6714_20865 [Bacteroidetes bacterium]|nr:MAG: hypothetical protein D6714_20865 [Bacteroidota bacterium]